MRKINQPHAIASPGKVYTLGFSLCSNPTLCKNYRIKGTPRRYKNAMHLVIGKIGPNKVMEVPAFHSKLSGPGGSTMSVEVSDVADITRFITFLLNFLKSF